MATEFEHRFLLREMPDLITLPVPVAITQGYLSTDFRRTVRIRTIGNNCAKITIKGQKTDGIGSEFEYDIPFEDAVSMLTLCGEENTLSKNRYEFCAPDGYVWEVDRFTGPHNGLVIAEIELSSSESTYEKPPWMTGVNITQDFRFANATLVKITRTELITNIGEVLKQAGMQAPLLIL